MSLHPPASFGLLLFLSLVPLGCGKSGPTFAAAKLEGNITLDKQPIASGTVQFMPEQAANGAVQPVSVPIQDGHYTAPAVPKGKVRVLFMASKGTGKMITEYSTPYEEVVSIIPPRYQQGIALEVAGDKLDQHFELSSR